MTTDAPASPTRTRLPGAAIIAALCVAVLAGTFLVAFHLGSERAETRVLTGRAYVGDDVATVMLDDWSYGFTPSAVTWYDDATHVVHHGSTAPCLQQIGYATIQFGVVPVEGHLDDGWYQVVWVRCLDSP